MTITVTDATRGTNNEKVADTAITLVPNGNLASGSWGLVMVACDNVATTNGTSATISVADNSGNGYTWTRLYELNQGTSAGAGVTAGLFLAELTAGLTTSHTITATITSTTTAKTIALAELAGSSGDLVLSASGATGVGANASTTGTAALSSLTNVHSIYIGALAAEEELTAAVSLVDADYTQFSAPNTGTGGANATNLVTNWGYLIETSTGDSFDNTGLTSADRVTILVRLEEAAPPAANPPQVPMMRRQFV